MPFFGDDTNEGKRFNPGVFELMECILGDKGVMAAPHLLADSRNHQLANAANDVIDMRPGVLVLGSVAPGGDLDQSHDMIKPSFSGRNQDFHACIQSFTGCDWFAFE